MSRFGSADAVPQSMIRHAEIRLAVLIEVISHCSLLANNVCAQPTTII